jgi:predicted aspartyl protease
MQTEVNFRLAGGGQPLILVPVYVNDRGPYEFILDTGAGTCLLSPTLAERLGVAITGTKEGRGAGGTVTLAFGQVDTLAIGHAKVENVPVGITDELSRIGAAVGTAIDGDIGNNYLSHFSLSINYRRGLLRLAGGEQGESNRPARAELSFKLAQAAKPLVLIPVLVNGAGPYQFAIDTGTSTTIMSPDLAETLGIKSVAAPAMTGGGGQVQASLGTVESLAVGSAKLEKLAVMVAPFVSILSQAAGARLDGIVGYNYLREFTVTIDYPRAILRLE